MGKDPVRTRIRIRALEREDRTSAHGADTRPIPRARNHFHRDPGLLLAESSNNMAADKRKLDWEAESSASNREPERRLLPCELQEDPRSVWADEDSVLGTDSHISGADDLEEFVKASTARGDYKPTRKRLEEIELWAKNVSEAAPEVALLDDAQLERCITEQPR
ncbi:hypothetical protein C8R47DRAFT_1227781 [Mycena vitilis]|nr:hypothetical protein C8R47DRAFT_1227781 [Mycena vitilis]